jgi:hypothetical protein
LDDKGVPNSKNQTNDYGKDMNMNYIRVMKKKEWRMVEVPILKNNMKQLRPKKTIAGSNPSNFSSVVGWSTFYHWGFRTRASIV